MAGPKCHTQDAAKDVRCKHNGQRHLSSAFLHSKNNETEAQWNAIMFLCVCVCVCV